MEGPQVLAGSDIVAAHVVRRHFHGRQPRLVQYVGSRGGHARNDNDVAHDHRAAGPAPPRDGTLEALCQVDLSAVAEVRIALACLRIERNEARANGGNDSGIGAVGPVREAARRAAARQPVAIGARRELVVPDGLARRGIERDHGADG